MAARWRTESGWTVEVVRLTGTPDHHDGTWLRVRYLGYWTADVRQAVDLAAWFPPAELREALARPASGTRTNPLTLTPGWFRPRGRR